MPSTFTIYVLKMHPPRPIENTRPRFSLTHGFRSVTNSTGKQQINTPTAHGFYVVTHGLWTSRRPSEYPGPRVIVTHGCGSVADSDGKLRINTPTVNLCAVHVCGGRSTQPKDTTPPQRTQSTPETSMRHLSDDAHASRGSRHDNYCTQAAAVSVM